MSDKHSLYDELQARGLLDYGQFIEGDLVRELLGVEMPVVGCKSDFDAVALAELSGVDQVRELLLGEGKYLKGATNGYRVLLPSENLGQIDLYLSHAQNKIRRARKLQRCSPALSSGKPNQTAARLEMVDSALRKKPLRGEGAAS